MSNKVRVRIAPSPTGLAHVGNAYTALFNFAFARKNKGEFIIRIEDTDVKRHVEGAEEVIYEALSWLGFDWEEGPDKGGKYGPYRQSERLDIYEKWWQKLLDEGKAYEDEGAIRFKNPGEDISWHDLIRGEVSFPGEEVTDFVIVRSNGWPVYNFVVAIDDIQMKISHVIRGEEHISNTPRQLALYRAFGEKPPQFAHLPTLRNKEKKKLSKRRDPVDLNLFREKGYLPEALVNFLCLLGWSHPEEKEIFSLDEFVRFFSLDRVRKAGPIFNVDKLDWLNKQYIKELSDKEFSDKVIKFAPKKADKKTLRRVAPLVKERINKLSDFENMAAFYFEKQDVDEKLFGENWKEHLTSAEKTLENIDKWSLKNINDALMEEIEEKEFKTGKFFMDLRIAITGNKVTPPINESLEILGKKKTLARLRELVN